VDFSEDIIETYQKQLSFFKEDAEAGSGRNRSFSLGILKILL
jgi:hypothetical protein